MLCRSFEELTHYSMICRDADAGFKKPTEAYGSSRSAEELTSTRASCEGKARGTSLNSHLKYAPMIDKAFQFCIKRFCKYKNMQSFLQVEKHAIRVLKFSKVAVKSLDILGSDKLKLREILLRWLALTQCSELC